MTSCLSITVLLELTFGIKTVTLEPSTGLVCPGQEVILTCNVTQTGIVPVLYLIWKHKLTTTIYYIGDPW